MSIKSAFDWKLFRGRLLIFLALLMLVEIVLRIIGYGSGDMRPNWVNFRAVDTLTETYPFFVNNKGLLVTNPKDIGIDNIYINRHGFRTKEFDSITSGKKKLLMLGDSFTWGMSAQPLDSSFADILARESGYEIINTGIPGTDPYQYEGIANWLIPEMKPDAVVVFFFMGNDIIKKPRTLIPQKPLYYYTNAGAIDSEIDGRYFSSANEAYNYIINEKYYLGNPKNIFEWFISKSALLSRLYSVRFRIQEKLDYENRLSNLEITNSVLIRIKTIAEKNSARIFFVLIPEVKEANMSREKYNYKYRNLLNNRTLSTYWSMPQFQKNWFNDYPDAHLNNKGHREYADFVMKVLQKQQ